ncbi:putative transcriptional antiterminator [Staphylococcus aureus]|nr:putative transcriptional antiterminator [Staphylococcus aureus]
MKDNENLINTMRDAVHLIDSMKIEHRQVDNWSMYIANHLLNEQAIPDVNQFSQYLQEKIANHPGWLLAPYPVAIPHLRDSIILKPVILVTILDTPIKMSNMQADDFKVKYMISMFIPDNEEMAQLVSQFIEEVGKHLEDIETFMKEPEKLRTILKSKISEKIKNFM